MPDHFFTWRDDRLYCEDVPVDSIAEETGSPVYIYSKKTFVERFRQCASAFADVQTTICFSVKSCSNLAILQALHNEGAGFDIVSGGELHRVCLAGGSPDRTVYSGVGKTEVEIRFALDKGIRYFNAESAAEVERINAIAASMDKVAEIGLRLNPDVDPKTHKKTTTGKKENKFGVDLEIASDLLKHAEQFPAIRFACADVHLGSPINSVEPYREALEKIVPFILEHRNEQCPLTSLDCGGGFGLFYRDETVPPFTDYADVIIPYAKQAGCDLLIEPGRSIAGNAAILVGTVEYTKSNGVKNFAIIDAGMNDLIRPAMYESFHYLWPTSSSTAPDWNGLCAAPQSGDTLPTDVVGPICESSDTFSVERENPPLTQGDRVAIFSAGAYGATMSSNYNSHPRAPEVLVNGDSWSVIRTRESWDDLTRLEKTL